jgi:putative membrane protein
MALPAILMAVPALAQTSAEQSDYWHYGRDWGWGHMVSGGLMMILFWGGVILVILFVVRALGGGSPQGAAQGSSRSKALDILHERFARGEIEKEEFEQRKRLLSD